MTKDEEAKKLADWRLAVLEKYGSQCANCERRSHIGVAFVVPQEIGGRVVVSNGVALCRDCKMSVEDHRILPNRIETKTPINFLISRDLHERVSEYVHRPGGAGTLSSLIRNMISLFVSDPANFEDIQFFQDEGSEVKVNCWVSSHQYDQFKALCLNRNLKFTDAFKALLLMSISRDYSNQFTENQD